MDKAVAIENITVLGATGSIGISTLDVCARHPQRYRLFALTANSSVAELAEQVIAHKPRYAVMREPQAAEQLAALLQQQGIDDTQVLSGDEGLNAVASHAEVDTVMAAIVGAAGLAPTMAAVESGKKVLLANKEALVMAGGLFMEAVKKSGSVLLPIDSEHNAIFQCMPAQYQEEGGSHQLASSGIRKILLTGSGGPFRQTPLEQLAAMTPDQACAHPNWSMGRKISVDSATMMNKGLEFIEACWLFNAQPEDIEIVVHPQSIIHSMVEYVDGSVLAQLGNPDMRTPIAHAMAWPERIESGVASLDIIATATLDFEAPDYQRFPCLGLAAQAVKTGKTAMVALNAANEVAVEAFLNQQIRFTDIPVIIESVLAAVELVEPSTLAVVQLADQQARDLALQQVANRACA
ncbi:1-deoxy-D-xylulose-5-phosphate reductoisomerase [Dasania sp. GY-MA-18]|uniref:1-deoxy-D-xylulose 5-phosphate reductoisomerase n=1 Tax=Dasania phycosphaerae TaxID=2950436 RepID=A0A9J6RQG7_9GAMM|nr:MULTISPECIES: 1-deoxy-D-xylulose-5-phosphate reductoisomerase [Dasania]MCR8923974.1 1-deoxy-D-xylulose-5-phosphate reductoisomerase [Dasania sp. GY-MA-18]MCZ0866408.1 1-deoxy-D-xylulose-5-phosphate reductoisomerase [Dasania phycosphaerae]MCZ0870132.1 1-deoxy-D-xylulose-5-phosphate reductoisomerase [Dasania phycosphaerae]